jgi:hypothetical protein
MVKFLFALLTLCVISLAHAEDDDVTKELQQQMEETQKKVQALQGQMQSIPGSHQALQANTTDTNTAVAPVVADESGVNMQDMQKLLDHPMAQKWLLIFKSPDFFPNIIKLKSHPKLQTLLMSQLGLFIFMMIVRVWRQSAAGGVLGRIWVSLYCAAIFWSCSFYFLPVYFLGEPFKKICELFWNTFK